jgi:group I intron endonuclease
MATGVVYLVTNLVNGNTYVGVTRFTPKVRWKQHVYCANRGLKTRLHSAIRKYGAGNFDVAEVASCLTNPGDTESDVIRTFAPVYNQTNGGEITKGRRVSPEVAAKIAAKNRGLKRTPKQNAANADRAKARHATDPAYHSNCVEKLQVARGAVNTEKRLAAVRAALTGKPLAPERVAALAAFSTGRKQSRHAIEAGAAKRRKKVLCVELRRTFGSILEASAALGVSNANIGRCCRGSRKTAGGYHFSFVGG